MWDSFKPEPAPASSVRFNRDDPTTYFLGKKAAKIDPRRLMIADFFMPGIAPPPPSCSWYGSTIEFGMMLNDRLGDCTVAALGHGIQVATLNTKDGESTVADSVVEGVYEGACGYNPSNPATDQGGVITDVLDYLRQNEMGGHKLYAYADTSPGAYAHVKQAIYLFGMVDIGLQLPISAQAQVGSLWTATSGTNGAAGSWGGHSVIVCGYDAEGLTCITWGRLQKMTWGFWAQYCDESHTLLWRAWMEHFSGSWAVNLALMEQRLQLVTN